jgi:hypothetical protein
LLSDAVQAQRRSPPSHPEGALSRSQLAGLRGGPEAAGDLTLWIEQTALVGWHAERRTTPGGQQHYSDLTISLVLTLRLVFRLALRQAEGFVGSVLRLLRLDLPVPDHTTLSRRGRKFANRSPDVASAEAWHVVIDSTGLQVFGYGAWHGEKYGHTHRSWRKLHIAVDADTGEIVASTLTDNGGDDAGEVPDLLGQVRRPIASVTRTAPTASLAITVMATSRRRVRELNCSSLRRHALIPKSSVSSSRRLQRGSLTVWFTEAAIAAWRAEPRTTRGGQPRYSPCRSRRP